jgi:anti-sigma factor RsiW
MLDPRSVQRIVSSQHLTEDEVAAYVDREVADTERRRIETHLSWCTACLDEVAALFKTLRFGSDSPAIRRGSR